MSAVMVLSMAACGQTTTTTEPESTVSTEASGEAEQESEASAEETEAVADTVDYGSTVTSLTVGDNEVLVYYPTPNLTDTSAVKTTCTAPVFLVFGGSAYDAQTAVTYATESGLAALAAQNGSSVCFVNPSGDTWSDADTAAYETIAQAISDSSTSALKDGITIGTDYTTGEETQSITGTQQRIYIYGIDAGADYVASVALKTVEAATFWGGTVNVTPAGVTLSGLTNTDAVEENDIPVVSIGNSDDVNAVLEEKCGSFLSEDTADYTSEYASVIGTHRRQAGVLLDVHDWAAEGIIETVETYTVATSADNASDEYAGSEEHPINYVTYYAEDLDVENGNVPLVLCFHGGGNTALYEAMATEWPVIGKENGFITVSVDLHYPNCTATEIVDLINYLETEYSIDAGKIYATGFSMGGCKSWDLYEQYPEVFAGLAPMDATYEPGVDSYGNEVAEVNTDTIVPVFYVGGETSPLSELPFQEEKVVSRIANLFEVNQVTTSYDVSFDQADSWTNKIWGIDGDMTYQVTDQNDFTDSTLTVNLFASDDGIYYTALSSASNQSHEVYARNNWAAWDFLSQFTRNDDGSITVDAVSYALPSDDGAVTDNSYNQN